MAWLLASLRQLRVERAATLGLVLLVLVTAFVFALAPRVLDRVADEALVAEVSAATPPQRNIQLIQETRVHGDARGPMYGAKTLGERYEAQFPPSIRDLVVDRAYLAESSRFEIVSDAAEQHFAMLRFQPGLDDRVELVAGRLPTGDTTTMPDWESDSNDDVRVFEVAFAVPSAEAIGAHVGDTLRLQLDPTDRLNGGHPARPGPANRIALKVVGLYRLADPDSPYWLGDRALAGPVLRVVSPEVEFLDVTPLISVDAHDPYVELTATQELPLRYTWRYYVDPTRLDSERADDLVGDLRRLESLFTTTQASAGPTGGVALRTQLLRIVEAQRAGWHSAEAVLAVIAVGPAAVALTALALVVMLVGRRRRPALTLQRGRGASTTQLSVATLFEGLLLIAPVALVAAALAILLVPTAPQAPSQVAVIIVAVVTLVLLVGATVPASRLTRAGGRSSATSGRASPRRLAFEGFVVGLAVVGAVLLRSRGVQGASSIGRLATPDPFVAAVPALLGLAAALVAMRLYPLAMRAVASAAAWRRDLVPALALRQAARSGTGGPILLVLLTTVALGAFSSATLVHLDRAADAVAWQETGAAFNVSSSVAVGAPLPFDLDGSSLPGVEAVAPAWRTTAAYANRSLRLVMLAVDAPAYQRVAAGTPMAPAWPAPLLGAASGPLPAILSSDLGRGTDPLAVGDTLEVTVEGRVLMLQVAELRPTFATLRVGEPFVVVSLDQLRATGSVAAVAITTLFLRAPDDAAPAIEAALMDEPGAALQGRTQRATELRTSPVVASVTIGVAVAAAVALAYAALAVAASLALSGAARSGEVAVLRTLGLTRRQSLGLVVVEHGPTVVVAFVAGTVLGLGLFAVLRPGLGLGTVVGSPLDIPLSLDPGQLGLLLLAIVAIVGVSIGLAAALQRSASPVDAIRGRIE